MNGEDRVPPYGLTLLAVSGTPSCTTSEPDRSRGYADRHGPCACRNRSAVKCSRRTSNCSSVSGGGAASASVSDPVTISSDAGRIRDRAGWVARRRLDQPGGWAPEFHGGVLPQYDQPGGTRKLQRANGRRMTLTPAARSAEGCPFRFASGFAWYDGGVRALHDGRGRQ